MTDRDLSSVFYKVIKWKFTRQKKVIKELKTMKGPGIGPERGLDM